MRDAELILTGRQPLQAEAAVFVSGCADFAARQQVADENDVGTGDGFAFRPLHDTGKRPLCAEGDARPQYEGI